MNAFTAYIIDDDAAMRGSVASALNSAGISVREYPSAEEFIPHSFSLGAACLILDLQMPGMKGLELIARLRAQHIHIPVIVLSGHGNIPAVVDTMKLGAAEFFEKPADHQRLINRVNELCQLETIRCDDRAKTQAIRDSFATLTDREKELIELMALGLSSKQIAANVGISLKTVENHRSHVLAKTRAANVASLVRMKMIAADRASYA